MSQDQSETQEDIPPPMQIEVAVEPRLAAVTKQINYHVAVTFSIEPSSFHCSGILRLPPRGVRAVRVTDGGCFLDPTDAGSLLEEAWEVMLKEVKIESFLQPWRCAFWIEEPCRLTSLHGIYDWLREG